jgi:hypothetical protein
MTNRHERRKHNKTLKIEQTKMLLTEVLAMGHICCWDGCLETYKGKQPDGWRHFLLYGAPEPVLNLADVPDETWDRDAVLCPVHTR